MQLNASSPLQPIDAPILTPIVRQSLRREQVQLLDWRGGQIGGGVGNPVSVGLYRFAGTAQDGLERLPWSVILKVIQSPANLGRKNMGESDDPFHWNYWKREPLIYQSGLLDTLPEGLVAPRCFGVAELPGNFCWLWLEDIIESDPSPWPLERYVLAARHLGRLNGMYLSEDYTPPYPWLGVNRFPQWLEIMPWRTVPWDHPRVIAIYSRSESNPFRRMLAEHQRFLDRLARLPRTICHGDSFPTNLKSRRSSTGQEQTVALDWALVCFEAIGDDLGQLVLGAEMNLNDAAPAEVDQALFASYLDGLRDSSCPVDSRLVRFGYTASAALRIGLFSLFLLGERIKQGEERTAAESTPRLPVKPPFELRMAEEAYRLLDLIP